jgi:hypothetical protein
VEQCTVFTEYRPKRGGQTEFWEMVKFDKLENISPRWCWVLGGIGSGKSHLGAAFVCSRAALDPTSRGLITANSYGQLTTSTLIALAEFCQQFHIPLEPSRRTVEETAKAIAAARMCKIFDASLLVISAEAFIGATENSQETGRGLQVRYIWADEYAYAPKSVFETVNGRLGRGRGKIKGLGVITSSPNKNQPFNWAYDTFINEDRTEQQRELYTYIRCLTADNSSLDEDYVRSLEAAYTPELAALELRGEFRASSDGKAFNHFDRARHVYPTTFDPALPLHLSFDFNRNPATCAVGQKIGDRLCLIAEIYQLNSDTFALGREAWGLIENLAPFLTYIHGDASGRAMTANSRQSNWDIISAALTGLPLNWQVPTVNPPIADTLNAANSLLHHGRISIDPGCKMLIKDLELVKLDGKGGLDKKAYPMLSHLADCFRYLAFDLFPLTTPTRGAIVGGNLKRVQF